ncbi:hypothetical protein B0H66DRAFT_532254 [Apodospora peruviana]|uniref:Ribonuclease H1 N-terminal domain-containing protein n=1 Tax=Apodospora peruviana TaxID=516989 RepID=A0AAE0M817_9PEZI|nr:hypothetical protein B0H66DRAFT_532254 [Apodospora peruviana]
MGQKFYAVARGAKVGIFMSWDEAKPLVNGYKWNKYEASASLKEAKEYIRKFKLPADGDGAAPPGEWAPSELAGSSPGSLPEQSGQRQPKYGENSVMGQNYRTGGGWSEQSNSAGTGSNNADGRNVRHGRRRRRIGADKGAKDSDKLAVMFMCKHRLAEAAVIQLVYRSKAMHTRLVGRDY